MFCNKCGYNVPKGKKNCPNCGQAAEYSQSCGGFYDIVKEGPGRGSRAGEMSRMSQQDAPKAGKLPIILCIISMVIAIGSLGGVFMMKQQVNKLETQLEKKAGKKELKENAKQAALDEIAEQMKAVEEFLAAKDDKEDLFLRYLKYKGFENVDMADFDAMKAAEEKALEKQQEKEKEEAIKEEEKSKMQDQGIAPDDTRKEQESGAVATTTETKDKDTTEVDE